MSNDTDSAGDDESTTNDASPDDFDPGGEHGADREPPDPSALATSGHVERTVLHCMVDADGRYVPTRVSDVLEPLAAVIERGDYGNLGPRNEHATVQRSSVRRTFGQLAEKGLIVRVADLDAGALASDRYAFGELDAGGDPHDPGAYAATSDDGRVTDWVLTEAGAAELGRLDAVYAAELDALAARFGRPPGATTARVEPER